MVKIFENKFCNLNELGRFYLVVEFHGGCSATNVATPSYLESHCSLAFRDYGILFVLYVTFFLYFNLLSKNIFFSLDTTTSTRSLKLYPTSGWSTSLGAVPTIGASRNWSNRGLPGLPVKYRYRKLTQIKLKPKKQQCTLKASNSLL